MRKIVSPTSMTNPESVDEKSPVAQKTLVNDHFEKQKTNGDSVKNSKEKSSSPTITINKQDSKKCIGKTHIAKVKSKQELDVGKQRVTRNKSKTLNKSPCLTEPSKKYDRQNKIRPTSKDQGNVVSPNHSITEYFSNLDLEENLKNVDENLDKPKSETKLKQENKKFQSPLHIVESTKKTLRSTITKKIDSGNHKLTEYFTIRRSDRKFTKELEFEKQKDLQEKIINEMQDGLEIHEFEEKGRGIITTKEFRKGDFVIEYIGDLIDGSTAKKRELLYSKNKNVGCYMYYFKHRDQSYCIDATKESEKFGRLINHSRKGNLISRIVEVSQVPHLVLFAKVDIAIGTELLYDYGDRNQESIKNHPWLNL